MTTITTILDSSNATTSPGRYVLDAEEAVAVAATVESEAPPPFPDVVYNGTGYYIDGEIEGLYDWETIFLSCIITLLPLLVALAAALAVRVAWLKYKRRARSTEDDFLREESSESQLPRPLHSHLLNTETSKIDETRVVINTDDPEEATDIVSPVSNGPQSMSTRSNHSNTNGSIITMTLKNNHLIVEKEERSDLEDDSRETTMKYSPSARDGVFVVEVQQGVRRSPGSQEKTSCIEQQQLIMQPNQLENSLSLSSDQCALVHNPPERYTHEETLEECDDNQCMESSASEQSPKRAKTGLTQSAQSISERISYGYTNQSDYEGGPRGYSETVSPEKTPPTPPPVSTKPKITSALYKKTIDLDDPLLSDVLLATTSNNNNKNALLNGLDDTA